MDEAFLISLHYKGQEIEFKGSFNQFGYSYRIVVDVNGVSIIFEPDEERNFRALVPGLENINPPPAKELIKAIGEKLEELFR